MDTPLLRKALEPNREFMEKEVFKTFSLDDYFKRILTPEQVADKIVDALNKPEEYRNSYPKAVIPISSYEF